MSAFIRSNPQFLVVIASGCILLLLFNLIAYNQAHSMLNFLPTGARTAPIESLSVVEKVRILFTGITVPKPQNYLTPEAVNLPYETHDIQSSDLSLEAWYVPTIPPKGTVLLYHGYAESKSSMIHEAVAFREMGFNTLLVDFRGSGGSDGRQTTVGFLEADDVAASFRHAESLAGATEHPIILYGHSMGAASILRSLEVHNIAPDAIIIEAVFAEMHTTVKNRFRSMGVPALPAASTLLFWASVQNKFWAFNHNPVTYATAVEIPTLMMHGTDDPRATIDEGERVYASIAAQNKQLIRFQDVGHESYLAARPERWQSEVETFLGNVVQRQN